VASARRERSDFSNQAPLQPVHFNHSLDDNVKIQPGAYVMTDDFLRRAEMLFHAALERTPQSREIFLQEGCGEDIELRRHLDLLIRQDERGNCPLE
jgi:hypothetical protein